MASASSSSALDMARNRGLERREEGATPLRKLLMNNLQWCVDPVEKYRGVKDILLLVYDSIDGCEFFSSPFISLMHIHAK